MAKVVVEEKAHQILGAMTEVNVEVHMIMAHLVLYCLVVEVVEDQVIQVERVVLEVEPCCFTQRRSSSMVPYKLMATMEAVDPTTESE